ncbi:MAG: L-histidine N(alpha)-methyltransferase [Pseudomonadota bacterium]
MTANVQLFQLSDQRSDRENDDIIMRLARQPRQLPFHLFYDDAGSALFQQITETPEYYLTRTEQQILQRYKQDILHACGNHRVWIEPGAGSCEKAAMLLSEPHMAAYVALDIAAAPLQQAAIALHASHPTIPVHLLVGDFRNVIPQVQSLLPGGARTIFYPGSSIGNFAPDEATDWLHKLAMLAGADGNLLVGFDVPKAEPILHAAYNDAAGITAAFHLNMLHHLRRRGFQLEPDDFAHAAHYNESAHRIEMHLRVRRATTVRWRDVTVNLAADETILTEYSYKYPLPLFSAMAARAGWQYRCHWQDDKAWFVVALFDRSL